MITPTFYPGQRVTCINADFCILLAQNPAITVPKQDEQYTVRKNFQFPHNVGITLEGIINVPIPGSKLEPNFMQSRFVALQELPAEVLSEEVSYADAV